MNGGYELLENAWDALHNAYELMEEAEAEADREDRSEEVMEDIKRIRYGIGDLQKLIRQTKARY